MANNRTLLSLLRTVQKRRSYLQNNPNAVTWVWLARKLNDVIHRRMEQQALKQYRTQLWDLDHNRLNHLSADVTLATMNAAAKIIQGGLVRVSNAPTDFWFKDDTKAYWLDNDRLIYSPTSNFTQLKDQGFVRWCSVAKDWAALEAFSQVWSLKEDGSPTSTLIADIRNVLKPYVACRTCQARWMQSLLKQHPNTDHLSCPICYKKVVQNRPHTDASLYSGYHSHRQNGRHPWTFLIQRLGQYDQKALPMGIELEMNLKKGPGFIGKFDTTNILQTARHLYCRQIELNPSWHNFYCEQDGSLGNGGFELITNPMTLEFHHQYWDKMLPAIREVCVGWNTTKHAGGTYPYGIHITFHKKYWGDFRIARLIKFMENQDNAEFMTAIAQRSQLYSGYLFGGTPGNQKLRNLCHIAEKKIVGSDRSKPVHVKGSELVEVRIFRSTLNTVSFLKNLEFIDAFLQWTKDTGWSESHLDFLAWLGSKPHHWARYSNLLAYLAKTQFAIWDMKHPLPNTWCNKVAKRKKVNPLLKPTVSIYPEEDL